MERILQTVDARDKMSQTAAMVGRRIRAARDRKGMTQGELATALGRTTSAISFWETGQRAPGLEDILRLARILGIAPADLLPVPAPPRVLARARAAQLAMRDLSSAVDRIVQRVEREPAGARRPRLGLTSPVEAAEIARKAGGQTEGPAVQLEPIMEAYGVRLVIETLPEGLSGLLLVVDDKPIVAVRMGDIQARRRFSAAHELGHVLLGHHDAFHLDLDRPEGVPPDYDWRQERAANTFAAALLMPAAWVREDVGRLTSKALAKLYRVSEQAMGIRLASLGVIADWDR